MICYHSFFLRPAGVIALLALLINTSASISVGSKDNVQIGGFISQGWIQSSGNNDPVEALEGTGDFREMAININTTVGSHLRIGAQGSARRLGNYVNDKVLLDWTVAEWERWATPSPSLPSDLSSRK